ncbi:MAG: response regulator transcription factor [Clostridiales bacterium]|nr:response regulator transcription factor [Clostridiales bacterium]MCD7753445.1 response regulator transcription factor [Clostridiales bacterium]MCD7761222.1 response regulator transcription factor [Clostridiales bacterium]MCD7801548.1 response regulator transcription factor [Clostridiales bacterium]MCD8383748.1 response regulator transcription factor [Clostridiales bacterium]
MKERIFVVEDDESIRRLLEFALTSQGYEVSGFPNALEALENMKEEPPALVLMDIMMEGLSGLEAVRLMRAAPRLRQVAVILLTARGMEEDKINGLDAGADDYITKPFSVMELCARVRALLRRAGGNRGRRQGDLVFDGIELSPSRHEVCVDGQTVELTLKEFALLQYLMERPDQSVSRQELLDGVWGTDALGESRTLDIHVGTLRQKLGDDAGNSRFIKTVRGVGYRFIAAEA